MCIGPSDLLDTHDAEIQVRQLLEGPLGQVKVRHVTAGQGFGCF